MEKDPKSQYKIDAGRLIDDFQRRGLSTAPGLEVLALSVNILLYYVELNFGKRVADGERAKFMVNLDQAIESRRQGGWEGLAPPKPVKKVEPQKRPPYDGYGSGPYTEGY